MKLLKIKDERALKATRENIFLLEKGPNLKAIEIFLNRDLADQVIMGWYIQSSKNNNQKKKKLPMKNVLPSKVILQEWRQDKEFPSKNKHKSKQVGPD